MSVILMAIGGATLGVLVVYLIQVVHEARRRNKALTKAMDLLKLSSNSMQDMFINLAKEHVNQTRITAIQKAIDIGLPIPVPNDTGHFIHSIDRTGNALVYSGPTITSAYVGEYLLNQENVEVVFDSIRDSLHTCAEEVTRYEREHGERPSDDYLFEWVKNNFIHGC